MKIKVEFEINVDIEKVEKNYNDEEVKYFLNVTAEEHLKKVTKFLEASFEGDCTDVRVNSLIITKSKIERKMQNRKTLRYFNAFKRFIIKKH